MFDDNHVSMIEPRKFAKIGVFLAKQSKKRAPTTLKREGTLPVSVINYELKKNYADNDLQL